MGAAQCSAAPVDADDEPMFRWRADIELAQPGALVALPLSVDAYAHTLQPELRDLRVLDARGERVAFALQAPRTDETRTTERAREAVLYALPARPARGDEWPSPIEITVAGDQIGVKRLGGPPTEAAVAPGWLIDLGERKPGASPHTLRLLWSGPAEFTTSFDFETSDDLRSWRWHGGGSVMALASATGALTQPNLPLPDGAARFLRLVWTHAGARPTLTGATVLSAQRETLAVVPEELTFTPAPADPQAPRALVFDLGGALPVTQLDLHFTGMIAPVRLEGRGDIEAPWRALGEHVFSRIERDAEVKTSPLPLRATLRQVRVVPDPRAPKLDAATTNLAVHASLATLLFATQGEPPFTLYAGSSTAAPGALPEATLIPGGEARRVPLGAARLGAWNEVEEVARRAEEERRFAVQWPLMLWTALLLGVGGLGFMVWQLTRKPP